MRAVLALPCAATTCRHASASAVLSSAGQRATHVKNNTLQLIELHHRSWRRRVHTTGLRSPKGNRLEGMSTTLNLVQKEQTRIRCCDPRDQHLSRNTSVHGLSAVCASVSPTRLLPLYYGLCCAVLLATESLRQPFVLSALLIYTPVQWPGPYKMLKDAGMLQSPA